jgi:hypothetical protein
MAISTHKINVLTQIRAGAFGTIFFIDPNNNITWIGMLSGSSQTGASVRSIAARTIYEDVKRTSKGGGKAA